MKYIFIGLLLFTVTAHANDVVSKHCLISCPQSNSSQNKIVIREIYILSNNPITKFADWVAYVITPETIGKSKKRTWKADPALREVNTLEPPDYKGAHKKIKTDRGHQVPLASFAGTPFWKETNYLSNITPQKSALNQGSWVRLESDIRKLALRYGKIWVMTGPLYNKVMPQLPGADEPHIVPSGYWKIIIVKTKEKYRHAAFVFPQSAKRKDKYCQFKSSVTKVELLSKLRFSNLTSTADLLCN